MAVTVAVTPRPVGTRVVRLLPAGRAYRRRKCSRLAASTGWYPILDRVPYSRSCNFLFIY